MLVPGAIDALAGALAAGLAAPLAAALPAGLADALASVLAAGLAGALAAPLGDAGALPGAGVAADPPQAARRHAAVSAAAARGDLTFTGSS
jgi:hypothetical protein